LHIALKVLYLQSNQLCMESFEKYNLSVNPFLETLKIQAPNSFWMDIFDVQKSIENILVRYALIGGSNIVLNYGPYGNGKTYTAKHFCSEPILRNLFGNKQIPFSLYSTFPSNNDPIKSLFFLIIDSIDFVKIKKTLHNSKGFDFIEASNLCSSNPFFQNIMLMLFTKMDNNILAKELKLYLYDNLNPIKLNKCEINRRLMSDSDYIHFLIAFFNFITYKKVVYPCVNLWLDDSEIIIHHNVSNLSIIISFLTKMMEDSFNLHIFLNFSKSSFADLKDFYHYLQPSVVGFIHQKNDFIFDNTSIYKQFILKLLEWRRIKLNDSETNFFPFTEEVVTNVISELGNNISLRRCCVSFSTLLEFAIFDNISIIDTEYYHSIKNEVVGCC